MALDNAEDVTVLPDIERLLSRVEARTILGVSSATFARMIARGDLPIVEVGGRTMLDPADIRAFIEARKTIRNDDGPVNARQSVVRSADRGGGDAQP